MEKRGTIFEGKVRNGRHELEIQESESVQEAAKEWRHTNEGGGWIEEEDSGSEERRKVKLLETP